MFKRDIIVVGASSGGLEPLETLVSQLLPGFPAAIFVVWHVAPELPSMLPQILARAGSLPATHAVDGEEIKPGHIYIAPPDHHLLVEPGYVRLTRGPKENRFRPSIDVLFRSAARAYGDRVIGVVLSGSLDDGASGLYAVKERDGKAVVQDPVDALYSSMPTAAIRAVAVDHCVPKIELGSVLMHLTHELIPVEREDSVSKQMDVEVGIARGDNALQLGITQVGSLSPYTCPECHGVLLRLKEGNLSRFRCHTGHAYSLNSLLTEVTESIEETLWEAVRMIKVSGMLMHHMADHLRQVNEPEGAELLLLKAEAAKRREEFIRQMVISK